MSDSPDIRPDLAALQERLAYLLDQNRPEAVQKRHRKGQRTIRENLQDLTNQDSLVEYGSLLLAAQRGRKSIQELIEQTPADGLVSGIASVNGEHFAEQQAQCMVLGYDYTVLAGTQGAFNHKKTDRMLGLAERLKLPIVFFLEGGGGRPGDVDFYPISVGGLDLLTFSSFAGLSGKVPRIAIVAGYCFAGNAALAGCADVIIATENCSIGMGGPAMIEGGGLGSFHPKEIGPVSVMTQNGVIDILVKDEAEAVQVAQQYLSYFQGDRSDWQAPDQQQLRRLIPEDRKWGYDVRKVVHALADQDSVLELRKAFGKAALTFLSRIEGRPVGIIANNPRHLGGAIDAEASDKMARFLQLCDSFGIPILSLCDTPGFMVGPDNEAHAMVRRASRLFVVGAAIRVPFMTIILRKAYGLGAMAMAGGSFQKPLFTIAWPTGELGAMGLEGAVKLGFKKELDRIEDPQQRQQLYDQLVEQAYQQGKAMNAASVMEIDEVIDPINSRRWISMAIRQHTQGSGTARYVDCW